MLYDMDVPFYDMDNIIMLSFRRVKISLLEGKPQINILTLEIKFEIKFFTQAT